MTRYEILRNILAAIIGEAPARYSKLYEKDSSKVEQFNNALSRAFIHLFLKVRFDLLDFEEREYFVTDGGNDGGFDAAYIVEGSDMQLNVVLFQSKYTRDLEKDANFPANAVEKAVNTISCVFDVFLLILQS